MRKALTVGFAVVAAGGILALGFAVAALGSSTSTAAPESTSETTTTGSTTTHTTTTKTTTTKTTTTTQTTTTPTTTATVPTTPTTPSSTIEAPATRRYSSMLGRLVEVPKPTGVSARAGGTLSLRITRSGGKSFVTWKLTFHRLTGKAIAAHIHRGRPGVVGPVVVSLCGPCGSGQSGRTQLSNKVVATLKAGLAYVNIHTAKNRAGEIRGRVNAAR